MEEDVKESVGTDVSSSENDTAAQDQSQEAPVTETADDLETKAIPYSRFKEVNEELRGTRGTVEQLQQRLSQLEGRVTAPSAPANPEAEQIKSALKQLGFAPVDEVTASFEQKLAQERTNMQVEQQLSRLEGRYDGKNGTPKFDRTEVVKYALDKGIGDPEIAYKARYERELTDWAIRQAIAKSGGTKSEASDGSGSSQAAGTSDQDLKTAIAAGDKQALRSFLKRFAPKGE